MIEQYIDNVSGGYSGINAGYPSVDMFGNYVSSEYVGKYPVEVGLNSNRYIITVQNWYAYTDNKVFIDENSGNFLMYTIDPVTHIIKLPMRSSLVSLVDGGVNLNFNLEGEDNVSEKFNYYHNYLVNVDLENIEIISDQEIVIHLSGYEVHSISIEK
jgi:hypothetical protein